VRHGIGAVRALPIDCRAMPPTRCLLYLHGFRSSPQSFKARRMKAWLEAHRPEVQWCCPALPPSPRQAFDLALALTADWPADASAVIGSSLGGFYARAVARRQGWPLVVLNPAVDPARDLAAYLGEQRAFHSPEDRFQFRAEYLDELRAIDEATPPGPDDPRQCLAIIAKGDEVLDWREMVARHQGATVKLLPGGDHALSDFDDHLPDIVRFLGWD